MEKIQGYTSVELVEKNRVTKWLPKLSDLDGWIKHFEKSGIKTAVAKSDDGKKYALYREDGQ